MPLHVAPFVDKDAVHHRIANSAVAPRRVMAKHAIEMRTEGRDRALRREVEIVGAESDDFAAKRLERVREE
jgi:hypothetical protein